MSEFRERANKGCIFTCARVERGGEKGETSVDDATIR